MSVVHLAIYDHIVRKTIQDSIPWKWRGIGWTARNNGIYYTVANSTICIEIDDTYMTFTAIDERLEELLLYRYTQRIPETIEDQRIMLKALKVMETETNHDTIAKRLLEE